MFKSSLTRCMSLFVAICHVLLVSLLSIPHAALAQSTDDDPPLIQHERVEQGILGDNQVFSATVTDNVSVSSVSLFYRFNADDAYVRKAMTPIASTDFYTASVETSGSAGSSIQYYIEAVDSGKNRSIQGFAFKPLERLLIGGDAPVASNNAAVEPAPADSISTDGISTGRKIVYGVLGLVVVGALAAAAGGGSSDDSGGGGNSEVMLNIRVEPL